MWKNMLEQGKPRTTIWRIRIACWITKATNTFSEYVTLIAFPLHQYWNERASMTRYAYIACLQSICYYQLDAHVLFRNIGNYIITSTCFGNHSVHHQEVSIVHAPYGVSLLTCCHARYWLKVNFQDFKPMSGAATSKE
jgi:hypothetical protein